MKSVVDRTLRPTMPMRGPKVGPSPAKLVDATPPEAAAEISSTWRGAIRSSDAETSTDPVSRRNVRIQSYVRSNSECQTEGWLAGATTVGAADVLNDLPGFLRRAVPVMVAALEENERSATFDGDLASTADVAGLDDPASVSIVPMHALSPYDPDAAASNDDADANAFPWRDLVPTGVSWNCSGYSLAVSYGRFDVTGWCDSPGALCVWNLRRADVDPRRPHVTLETSSCLQCVAFHPTDPSFVAAGSLDGEVMVWDLSRDDKENAGDVRNASKTVGDALVGKSEVSDASHREPVTSVHWSFNLELGTGSSSSSTGTTEGYVDGHELVSTGGDGRVLVWCPGSMARPVFGYELRAQRGRDGGAMTAWGAASACFMTSGAAPGRDKKRGTEGQTGAFLVGSDGGPVFRCLTRHTRGMTTEFHAKCIDNESDTPPMYSPIKQEYDGHAGSVHSVAVNPHDTRVFSTCGSDGAMRVYTKMYKRSLLELSPLDGALFSTQWSPTRPGTLACGGVGGRVCLYDLTVTGGEDVQPTAQFRACDRGTNVQGVAFNPVLPEYLATADGFAVRVWELGLGLTTPRSNEVGFIDAVANAETAAEASAVLDAAKASRR